MIRKLRAPERYQADSMLLSRPTRSTKSYRALL